MGLKSIRNLQKLGVSTSVRGWLQQCSRNILSTRDILGRPPGSGRNNTTGRGARSRILSTAAKVAQGPSQKLENVHPGSLESREALRKEAPIYTFRIVGVSFEGRQKFVSSLQDGEAIMMVPEPENPYDEHAIAIKKLNGEQLGYVPKDVNQRNAFRGRGVLFGHIMSMGPTVYMTPPLYGASVNFKPRLRPLHTLAAPKALRAWLETLKRPEHDPFWQEISSKALALAGGRCSISGALSNELAVCPTWREDTRHFKFRLDNFVCIDRKLLTASRSLLDENPSQEARWTVQSINGWVNSEMDAYITYLHKLLAQRENEDWGVDLKSVRTKKEAA